MHQLRRRERPITIARLRELGLERVTELFEGGNVLIYSLW